VPRSPFPAQAVVDVAVVDFREQSVRAASGKGAPLRRQDDGLWNGASRGVHPFFTAFRRSNVPGSRPPPCPPPADEPLRFHGVHHVGLLCASLQTSLDFYCGVLGLRLNPDRPDAKLPYRGAWLWAGPEMVHLLELPNPDPAGGRPAHGGRDRHTAFGLQSIGPLEAKLAQHGIPFTRSESGRRAIFFRDPDQNAIECFETGPWR
jgi:glyoxylase I family protein